MPCSHACADPYVKVSLMCDGRRLKKRKTSTKRNTLNPVYNEAIVFDVPPESIDQIHLSIAVMDYDRWDARSSFSVQSHCSWSRMGRLGSSHMRNHIRELSWGPRIKWLKGQHVESSLTGTCIVQTLVPNPVTAVLLLSSALPSPFLTFPLLHPPTCHLSPFPSLHTSWYLSMENYGPSGLVFHWVVPTPLMESFYPKHRVITLATPPMFLNI